jgi:hypothetical protein
LLDEHLSEKSLAAMLGSGFELVPGTSVNSFPVRQLPGRVSCRKLAFEGTFPGIDI